MPGFNLSPRQLQSVVAVAELGNISHAAVELSISQPSLSRTIAKIEAELGVELFHRDSNGATPTEAGARLATRAAEVLRQLEDIEDEMRSIDGNLHGRITVVMPDTIGHTLFLPLLDRFTAEHQDVELRVMGAHPNHVPLALAASEADVGIVSSAHRHQGLELRTLAIEKLHLVGPPRNRAKGPVNLKSIVGLPLALPGIQPGLRPLIDRAFANMGLRPNVVIEADTQDTLIELIREGRAYSIMSYAGVLRPAHRGEVETFEIRNPSIERTLSTAFPRGRNPTRLMRAVADQLHQLVADLAPQVGWSPDQQH